MLKKFSLPLLIALSVITCTHCSQKTQGIDRSGSQVCEKLKQRIQAPDYTQRAAGPNNYTPADQARLIQEYSHVGCE